MTLAGPIYVVEMSEKAPLPAISRLGHLVWKGAIDRTWKTGTGFQMNWQTSGCMDVTVCERTYRMEAGTLLLVPPSQNYHCYSSDTRGTKKYHVHFDFSGAAVRSVIPGTAEAARLTDMLDPDQASFSRTLLLPVCWNLPRPEAAEDLVVQVMRDQRREQQAHQLAAEAHFLLFLQGVSQRVREALKKDERPSHLSAPRLQVSRAVDFIERSIAEAISLRDVAEHLRVNHIYLSRIFKEQTDSTVGEFILKRKMVRAKETMLRTRMSLKEIAGAVGFDDPLYFSRRFRQVEGISPRAFLLEKAQGLR